MCGGHWAGSLHEESSPGGGYTLYKNDFRDLKQRIPSVSVDAVITDPPYGSGGFTVKDVLKTSKSKYVSSDASYQSTLPDIDGDSLHPEAWKQLMMDACLEAKRVLKPGGILIMFIDWRNLAALQSCVHATGLTHRGVSVWDKGPGSRPMKNGFRNQAEYLLWATQGKMPSTHPPVYLPGVFRHTTMTNGKVHITQKPESLMAEIIRICPPGGLIFDPFMGSGTTGVAALKSGRKFIGCETVEQYFLSAKKRCEEAVKISKK